MSRITELQLGTLSDCLEEADCGDCGKRLAWTVSVDGVMVPDWSAKCCGNTYKISINTVEIFRIGNDNESD